jgi:hypothetical protein
MRYEYRSASFLKAVSERTNDAFPSNDIESVLPFILSCESSFESFLQNYKDLVSLYSITKFQPLIERCIENHLDTILLKIKPKLKEYINLNREQKLKKNVIYNAVFKKVKHITGKKPEPTSLEDLVWEVGSYFAFPTFPNSSIILMLNSYYQSSLLSRSEPTESEWKTFVTEFLQEFRSNKSLSFQLVRRSPSAEQGRESSNHTLNLMDLLIMFYSLTLN